MEIRQRNWNYLGSGIYEYKNKNIYLSIKSHIPFYGGIRWWRVFLRNIKNKDISDIFDGLWTKETWYKEFNDKKSAFDFSRLIMIKINEQNQELKNKKWK